MCDSGPKTLGMLWWASKQILAENPSPERETEAWAPACLWANRQQAACPFSGPAPDHSQIKAGSACSLRWVLKVGTKTLQQIQTWIQIYLDLNFFKVKMYLGLYNGGWIHSQLKGFFLWQKIGAYNYFQFKKEKKRKKDGILKEPDWHESHVM